MKNKPHHINLFCRVMLGFLFIYHGLVPKVLWLSAAEIQLMDASGIGIPATIASPAVGIGEVIFGLIIIFWRTTIVPVYIATASLVFLLLFVAIVSPVYLIEVFNVVTTNLLGLGFCYLIIITNRHHDDISGNQ